MPVHPAAGDVSYVRWANGTVGTVTAVDPGTGWLRVESSGKTGWVTARYLTVLAVDPEDEPPSAEIPSYVVGTWNLEWFKDGAVRGFPEYNNGGPKYGSRTESDYQRIAQVIRDQLLANILILNEISGTVC